MLRMGLKYRKCMRNRDIYIEVGGFWWGFSSPLALERVKLRVKFPIESSGSRLPLSPISIYHLSRPALEHGTISVKARMGPPAIRDFKLELLPVLGLLLGFLP